MEQGLEVIARKVGEVTSTPSELVASAKYFENLKEVMAAFETGDTSVYWSKSTDGGKTCPLLKPGTRAILPHKDVIAELETYCQRWISGILKWHKGPSFSPTGTRVARQREEGKGETHTQADLRVIFLFLYVGGLVFLQKEKSWR